MSIIHEKESYAIMGLALRCIGIRDADSSRRFARSALRLSLHAAKFRIKARPGLSIFYKGHPLTCKYFPDFICYDRVIVELKAVSLLTDEHRARVHNYLRGTDYRLGLLVNFAHYPKFQYERIVL